MKLPVFYEIWRVLRVAALLLAGLFAMGYMVMGYGWNLEIEYTGPGSEAERLDREYNSRENERAHDRVMNDGSRSERDLERARDHEREHGA